MPTEARREARLARHARVRKRISGTAERPRLAVFRSLTHIYAQLIDDRSGRTIAAALDLDAAAAGPKTERAKRVGTLLAERAAGKGISEVVFDRGGYLYHGRVKALADAARAAGLRF
jgi:large subunit ribosomal protein L18